jgi:hypothetical protein
MIHRRLSGLAIALATGLLLAAQAAAQSPPPPPAPAPPGERTASARLSVQRECARSSVRVTVSGRAIRRVTFRAARRVVRTVSMPAGRRSMSVSLPVRHFRARRLTIQARVEFRDGTPPRTLIASARRCARRAVPQFTG